ncbi:MAG TPA: PAS domain-containing protein [Candidatus Baltobacteraceae bacterium]
MDPSLLSAVVERQQDGVFIIEMNAEHPLRPTVVYANPAFHALTGFDADDIAKGGYPQLLGPETDRALVYASALRVASGEPVACEVLLYRKDGSHFWADVRSHPLDEPVNRCVLMLRDVSARRASDERLRLLSQALEQANDAVVITDATPPSRGGPLIVYANPAFLAATGYTLEEVVGQPSLSIVAGSNDPVLLASVRRNVELGLSNEREALITRKDRSTFWMEVVAKPFDDAFEQRSYRILIGRDITLRKRAYNQISLLMAAAEGAPDRIVLYECGAEGRLAAVYENASAARDGRHRLLEMLSPSSPTAERMRAQLLRGELVAQYVVDERSLDGPSVDEFAARAIRNVGDTIEAVITIERRIPDGAHRRRKTDR